MAITKTSGNCYNNYSDLQSGSYSKKISDAQLAKESKKSEKEEQAQEAADLKELENYQDQYYGEDEDLAPEAGQDELSSTKQIFAANGYNSTLIDDANGTGDSLDTEGDLVINDSDNFIMGEDGEDSTSLEQADKRPVLLSREEAKAQVVEIKKLINENSASLPEALLSQLQDKLAEVEYELKSESKFAKHKGASSASLQQIEADILDASTHDLAKITKEVKHSINELSNLINSDVNLSSENKQTLLEKIQGEKKQLKQDPFYALSMGTDAGSLATLRSEINTAIEAAAKKAAEEAPVIPEKYLENKDLQSKVETLINSLNPEDKAASDALREAIYDNDDLLLEFKNPSSMPGSALFDFISENDDKLHTLLNNPNAKIYRSEIGAARSIRKDIRDRIFDIFKANDFKVSRPDYEATKTETKTTRGPAIDTNFGIHTGYNEPYIPTITETVVVRDDETTFYHADDIGFEINGQIEWYDVLNNADGEVKLELRSTSQADG